MFSSNNIFFFYFTYKERRQARSRANFQKKFKCNDQQRPKNLTQVTESAWQVEAIEKVHVFVDPEGEKIDAMGSLSGRIL